MSDEDGGNVDMRLLDQRVEKAFERRESRGRSGGGGDDFEGRLSKIETAVSELKLAIGRLDGKIDQLPKATDIAELKGRVSQLPTVWQLFGLIVAIFGLAFALIRFAMPH